MKLILPRKKIESNHQANKAFKSGQDSEHMVFPTWCFPSSATGVSLLVHENLSPGSVTWHIAALIRFQIGFPPHSLRRVLRT